jgi:hypothetical protein
MKDLGVVNVTLKIKISIIFYGLVFSLNLIILKKKLDNFFKNDNNIFKILIDISVHMSKNKGEWIYQLEYSWLIKNLMYLMK